MAIHTVRFKDGKTLHLDTDDPQQRDVLEQLQAKAMGYRKPEPIARTANAFVFFTRGAVHKADDWLCEHVTLPDFSKESPELQRYRNMTPAEHARAQREADSAYARQCHEAYSGSYNNPNEGYRPEQNESFEAYEARKKEWRGGQTGDLFGNRITLPPEE